MPVIFQLVNIWFMKTFLTIMFSFTDANKFNWGVLFHFHVIHWSIVIQSNNFKFWRSLAEYLCGNTSSVIILHVCSLGNLLFMFLTIYSVYVNISKAIDKKCIHHRTDLLLLNIFLNKKQHKKWTW